MRKKHSQVELHETLVLVPFEVVLGVGSGVSGVLLPLIIAPTLLQRDEDDVIEVEFDGMTSDTIGREKTELSGTR